MHATWCKGSRITAAGSIFAAGGSFAWITCDSADMSAPKLRHLWSLFAALLAHAQVLELAASPGRLTPALQLLRRALTCHVDGIPCRAAALHQQHQYLRTGPTPVATACCGNCSKPEPCTLILPWFSWHGALQVSWGCQLCLLGCQKQEGAVQT